MKTVIYISTGKKETGSGIVTNVNILYDLQIIELCILKGYKVHFIYTDNVGQNVIDAINNNFNNNELFESSLLNKDFNFPKSATLITDFSKMAYLYTMKTFNKAILYLPYFNEISMHSSQDMFDPDKLFLYATKIDELFQKIETLNGRENEDYIKTISLGDMI